MDEINSIWSDVVSKLWHMPKSLDDLTAWAAVVGVIIGIFKAIQMMWNLGLKTPMLWKVPRFAERHRTTALIFEDAAFILRHGPIMAQAYALETLRHLAALLALGIVCWIISFTITPSVTGLFYGLLGALIFGIAYSNSSRRQFSISIAAVTPSLDLSKIEKLEQELTATLNEVLPLPLKWPFSMFSKSINKARRRLLQATEGYMTEAKRVTKRTASPDLTASQLRA